MQRRCFWENWGYINKISKRVGIAFVAESGTAIAEFTCGVLNVTVAGVMMGEITPINTNTTSYKLTFNVVSGEQAVQLMEMLSGNLSDTLTAFGEKAALMSDETFIASVAEEVKA